MKRIIIIIFIFTSYFAHGQKQMDVNKLSGSTKSNSITEIDSIRFTEDSIKMEIILNNGSVKVYSLPDIDNVTFSGQSIGAVNNLDCVSPTINGTLVDGIAASGVSAEISYTGGNGGPHNGQTINSTGVTGLTATLDSGNFVNGAGTLTYYITGVPDTNGTADFAIDAGGHTCVLEVEVDSGEITTLDCTGAKITDTLVSGTVANGASAVIDYSGGNGGYYNGQSVNSTGVSGLTATINSGNFTTGTGTLTFEITGTPLNPGTANFTLSIGGQSCTLSFYVPPFMCKTSEVTFTYKDSTVTYGTVKGQNNTCWLDRNLGASRVANSISDQEALGDLFQWGRGDDGHQNVNSGITGIRSNTDTPNHNNFIEAPNYSNSTFDWRNPQNPNLWQGVNGTNNPCPSGFRLPTEAELEAERLSWSSNDAAGAFNSPLKLPAPGFRYPIDGMLEFKGSRAVYWSSTTSGIYSRGLFIRNNDSFMTISARAGGNSVRCIRD